MFRIEAIRDAIEKVKLAGRQAIRFEVYDDEANEEVQSITIEQAEKVLKYLKDRLGDVWFEGLSKEGKPMFGHPLESFPWEIEWEELEGV